MCVYDGMRLSVPPSTPPRQPARPNTTSRLTDRLTARLTVKRIISSKENWPGTWKRGRSTRQLWPRLSRPSMFTTCVASCGAICTRSISSGRCVCRHRHQLSQKPNASPTSSCRERRKRRMTRSVLYLCVCGSGWHGMRWSIQSVSQYVCMYVCMHAASTDDPARSPNTPYTHHTQRLTSPPAPGAAPPPSFGTRLSPPGARRTTAPAPWSRSMECRGGGLGSYAAAAARRRAWVGCLVCSGVGGGVGMDEMGSDERSEPGNPGLSAFDRSLKRAVARGGLALGPGVGVGHEPPKYISQAEESGHIAHLQIFPFFRRKFGATPRRPLDFRSICKGRA